jgi:hypothetical protein
VIPFAKANSYALLNSFVNPFSCTACGSVGLTVSSLLFVQVSTVHVLFVHVLFVPVLASQVLFEELLEVELPPQQVEFHLDVNAIFHVTTELKS